MKGECMHYYKDYKNGFRLSLVGSVITVFNSDGYAIRRFIYKNHKDAVKAFFSVA